MATQTRLFLGLIRPPKLIGLPIMYAMVWLFGFVLLFLWVQSWPVIIIAALAYPALWKAADWDPAFLEVMVTALERVIEDRKPTLIIIDEAWKALDNPYFADRLSNWLVTARKQNAVVVMMTQYASQHSVPPRRAHAVA